MEASGVATWVELAVAPEWRRNTCRIMVHAVGGKADACFAISMNQRWLCSGNGGLTVFCGLGTALHFLKLMRIDNFETGERPAVSVPCNGSCFGLRTDDTGRLRRCLAHQEITEYHG